MAKQGREQEISEEEPSLEQILRRTAGSWRNGDGLAYQREIRGEWERSPARHPFVVLPYVLPG